VRISLLRLRKIGSNLRIDHVSQVLQKWVISPWYQRETGCEYPLLMSDLAEGLSRVEIATGVLTLVERKYCIGSRVMQGPRTTIILPKGINDSVAVRLYEQNSERKQNLIE
jgi:hypothetical protein